MITEAFEKIISRTYAPLYVKFKLAVEICFIDNRVVQLLGRAQKKQQQKNGTPMFKLR